PALHSFPTRRSSDLCPGGVLHPTDGLFGIQASRVAEPASEHHSGSASPCLAVNGDSLTIPLRFFEELEDFRQLFMRRKAELVDRDRKSTRLNSSHDQ